MFVIAGREHLNVSRVSDDTFDLRCAVGPENLPNYAVKIAMTSIADPDERELVREMVYLAMNFDHFRDSIYTIGAIRPSAIQVFVGRLRRLLGEVRRAGLGLHEIDQRWLEGWLQRNQHLAPSTLNHLIIVWRRLFVYRHRLSFRSLEVEPWGQRPGSRIARYKAPRENKTPLIPEQIYGPMLRWCIFLIDAGVRDVLEVRRNISSDPSFTRYPTWVNDALLDQWVAKLRATGARVPIGADDLPALPHISRQSRLSIGALRERATRLNRATHELGTTRAGADFTWSLLPYSNQPWTSGLDGRASFLMLRHLLAACYFVVAILSGMRDGEVTALRRGCLRKINGEDGKTYRYLLDGLTFKGSPNSSGEPHTWVVVEPVARAIAAAEALQDHLASVRHCEIEEGKKDLLFLSPLVQGGNPAFESGTASGYLNDLSAFLNKLAVAAAEHCAPHEAADLLATYGIPKDENGKIWRWDTRQLRRTLARFIAREPFGSVAGMLQYGHVLEITFEGYAGTSESGFPDEVREERELARLDDVVEFYEDFCEGHPPGGPKGADLEREFAHVRDELGDFPGQVVDERRRNKMLKNIAVTLHPGYVNDCFFYRPHALCLTDGGDDATPLITRCRPEKCPNSLITRRHSSAIDDCIGEMDGMLSTRGLGALQRSAITTQREKFVWMKGQATR